MDRAITQATGGVDEDTMRGSAGGEDGRLSTQTVQSYREYTDAVDLKLNSLTAAIRQ